VSTCNRSVTYEEIEESEENFIDLLPMRHLYISNASMDLQPANQVVRVSGSITISF